MAWTNSRRPPDSREEDSWLSDEQLNVVRPSEGVAFQAPVPTRSVSNGEYMPFPQTDDQKHVEYRIREMASEAARRLGRPLGQFLASTGGLAVAFLAMNEVYGKMFDVDKAEVYEPEAARERGIPRDVFVFDDQTHMIRSSKNAPHALRAMTQGSGSASYNGGFISNPYNGGHGNPEGPDEFGRMWPNWDPLTLFPDYPPNPGPGSTGDGQFHLGQYILREYLESQVSCSIISNVTSALVDQPDGPSVPRNISEALENMLLTGWQTSQCRDFINQLAGSRRAYSHAQLFPGRANLADPVFGDYVQWQIEYCNPDSWKGYNVARSASPAPENEFMQWRLDDEVMAYPMYSVIRNNRDMLRTNPGFFNICIHKGLQADMTSPFGDKDNPQNGNPDDIVKVSNDWPEFNWIIYHSCFRPHGWSLQAFLDLMNRPGAEGPTFLVDSDGRRAPNIRWTTQFAQICGGKYVAGAEPSSKSPSSPGRLPNVYAELGSTMATTIVTFPTVWAHMIGQLLHYMGSDKIIFGTDALWYGGPQWQVEALWRYKIPDEICERYDYPQITEADKRKILGLNSARLYGLSAPETIQIGRPGSAYQAGQLASYPLHMQPGSLIDQVLTGPGYPAPVRKVTSLIPDDTLTQVKETFRENGGRTDTPHGWVHKNGDS
jgi:predicted TIM-barrel fold metal-dependent hydrolase